MEEEQIKDRRKRIIISVLGLVLLVVLVIGISYAAFSYAKKGTKLNTITTASITMSYNEGENGISIVDALPIEDSVGMTLSGTGQVFDFTVNINMPGKGSSGIGYEVTAEKDSNSTLGDNDVKLYLERSTDNTNYVAVDEPSHYIPLEVDDDFGATAGEMVLDTNTTTTTQTFYYRLRMWVDQEYESSTESKSFTVTVNVYGSDTAINSKKYDVAIKTNNITSDSTGIKIGYNGTGDITVTAPEGFYLSDVNCTNGYTTNANIGESAIGSQTIQITNNGNTGKGTCTFTGTGFTGYANKPSCANNNTAGSCASGTEVGYYVAPGVKQNFYVLKDNGSTLTLITDRVIVNTLWDSSGNNANGPRTATQTLENATNSWTEIPTNTYNESTGTATRARMITKEEAVSVGCQVYTNNSCPAWLTENDGTWHWTSTYFAADTSLAYYVTDSATSTVTNGGKRVNASSGVRAVITISK